MTPFIESELVNLSADDGTLPTIGRPEPSLRQVVADRIRFNVVSGQALPGTIFTAPSLAKKLGISTTPVREALLELSAKGLLEPLRNRGFQVVEPSLQDLRDLFALREQLETYAIITLTRRGVVNVDELNTLAKAVEQAVSNADTMAYLATDRAFHLALIEGANNRRLTDMIMDLRDNMRLYGIHSAQGAIRQQASVREHFQLVELAHSGDADQAATLMAHHIREWEPVFTAAIVSALARGSTLESS